MDDELRFHVEMETEANIGRGLAPGEARRAALRDLGGVAQTKEEICDVRRLRIEWLWHDARFALQGLRRNRGFSAFAIATLALGIGVNTAATAVVYGVLVRPLPYPDASHIIVLNLLFPDGGDLGFSPTALQNWLPRLRTFDVAAGYYSRDITVRARGTIAVVPAAFVTDRFFDVLSVPAESGRARIGVAAPEIVVSQRALAQHLRIDRTAGVGIPVSIGESTYVIGGMMPDDFAFPNEEIGVWIPSRTLISGTKPEGSGYSKIVARLKPGVTLEQARRDADRVRLELNPKSREGVSITVLGETAAGRVRSALLASLAGALLVLLVACANVATLFIGRDIARERELAARLALGASPSRLVLSALVEALLIAFVASLAGLALGAATLKLFLAAAQQGLPGLDRVSLDRPVFLAIAILTMVVTLASGSLPAWHASRMSAGAFLRSRSTLAPQAWRLRAVLVVAQIALSCVLLIGAGLLTRTVVAVMHEDHGFDANGAIEARMLLSNVILSSESQSQAFVRNLLDRMRALPDVQFAGFGSSLPPRAPIATMAVRTVTDDRDESRFLNIASGTSGYLRAMGARFVAGRDFAERDSTGPPSVILSESAARFFFPKGDAIGRQIPNLPKVFGLAAAPQVIGVVRDIKYDGLDAPPGPTIYLNWEQRPFGRGYLIVRSSSENGRLGAEIRRAAEALDSSIPIAELQSLDAAVARSIANRRIRAVPAVAFGLLAVAVALSGLLATLLTLVAERRRDFAVRSAIGATPTQLMRTVARLGLPLAGGGLLLGIGLGGVAARSLSSLLYRVSPYDPPTFAATAALIGGGAVLTTLCAALRVRSIDPISVLRYE
jgi:putative ABC transport system permease protein